MSSTVIVMALALAALPHKAPEPADNPTTPAKVELGKMLYFDPRLSSTGSVSCNSCHNVMAGGDDNLAVSVGVKGQTGGRSAPTVWNAAFLTSMFWDGRAATLEEQAKGPLLNPVEMGMPSHAAVMDRLREIPGYRRAFADVFGGKEPMTIDNAAKAIAAFERMLITPNSAYDRFASGDDKALSDAAKRGLKLVQEAGCTGCHAPPVFSSPGFQKFPLIPGSSHEARYELTKDPGRFAATNVESDKGFWRVPTLRNVAITAPYFHNGSVATLDEAVRVMGKTQLNRDFSDPEVKDVVAFLESLTGEFPTVTMPRLPETSGFSGVMGQDRLVN